MQSFETSFNQVKKILENIRGIFEKNDIEKKLKIIEQQTADDNFWKDQKKVKNILKEKKLYDYLISSHKKLSKEITNLKIYII